MNSILSKDVKKGAKVTFKDGHTGIVMDKSGTVYRTMKVPLIYDPNQFDIGSAYIHDWDTVEQDGRVYKIMLTEKQKKCQATVRALGM